MSGAATREETIYRCPACGGVLVITDLAEGVLRAVLCKRCNRRQTVFLGGWRAAPDRAPAPATAPNTSTPVAPPVERGPVRARRG